jgi:hypothetical protein
MARVPHIATVTPACTALTGFEASPWRTRFERAQRHEKTDQFYAGARGPWRLLDLLSCQIPKNYEFTHKFSSSEKIVKKVESHTE